MNNTQDGNTPAQQKTSHIHPTRSLNRTCMHVSASVHVDCIKYGLAVFLPTLVWKPVRN